MTPKMEEFARQLVNSGLSQADAYRRAYKADKMSPATIRNESYKLMQRHDVTTMVDALRRDRDRKTVDMSVGDRQLVLNRLRSLLLSPEGTAAENIALKAASLLGQSVGLFQKRIEVDDKRDRSPDEIRREIEDRISMLELDDTNIH